MSFLWSQLTSPAVMAIVNVTPDSFSDGGQFVRQSNWQAHIDALLESGADVLDIGGESTRPGAQSVSIEDELERTIPVIEYALAQGARVSVDTSKPEVMREAIKRGVHIINDVNALAAEGALDCVAQSEAALCLMHMQGEPRTMQHAPHYENVVIEVRSFLHARAEACVQAGIARERICLDPGFGFGKTQAHNLALLAQLPALVELGYPVLVGLSRKSLIGQLTGAPVAQRMPGSVALALLAVQAGARIVRVHDVAETVQALKILQAVEDVKSIHFSIE